MAGAAAFDGVSVFDVSLAVSFGAGTTARSRYARCGTSRFLSWVSHLASLLRVLIPPQVLAAGAAGVDSVLVGSVNLGQLACLVSAPGVVLVHRLDGWFFR